MSVSVCEWLFICFVFYCTLFCLRKESLLKKTPPPPPFRISQLINASSNYSLIQPKLHIPNLEHFHEMSTEHGNKNTSMIVWAGCHDMKVLVGDHALDTGFAEMKKQYLDLVEERSQFRLRMEKGTDGALSMKQEKIIRLENGFFSTMKEKSDFELRQEGAMKNLAQSMGITIAKAKPQGTKCGPNDMCPHGSGKKFKKCCNRPDGICTGKAGADW